MISVIVPVYNIADYLPRCLDSILNQTYKELEIILVDDGSTDGSGDVCDLYAERDSRIKVIHKENGGVSSARNVGLDIATGDYIGFVDGDDLLAEKMFEVLLMNAEQYQCDISCCQLVTINVDGTRNVTYNHSPQLFEKKYIIENYFSNKFIKDVMYGCYNKLFKRSLIDGLRYKKYKYGEDILFVFEAIEKSNRLYYDNYEGYYYIHRENSAMTSVFSVKRLDYISAIREIEEKCKTSYYFAYANAKNWVYQHVLITMRQIIANRKQAEYCEWIRKEKKYLRKNRAECLKRLRNIRKLDYFGVMYCPIYIHLLTNLKKRQTLKI